jgi:hypothetical protein
MMKDMKDMPKMPAESMKTPDHGAGATECIQKMGRMPESKEAMAGTGKMKK